MSELGTIGKVLFPVAGLLGLFNKPKATPQAMPLPAVDQSAAAAAAAQTNADDVRRRRGAGADALTGPSGAEATTPGAKVLLGQ